MAAPASAPAASNLNTVEMLRVASATPSAGQPAAASELPEKLSSKVLYSHAQAYLAKARACLRTFGFCHEVIQVQLEVEGATGRVVRAQVAGRFATMPVGNCLSNAARGVGFPKFKAHRQTIKIPVTGR
jgi:hypothetical protein